MFLGVHITLIISMVFYVVVVSFLMTLMNKFYKYCNAQLKLGGNSYQSLERNLVFLHPNNFIMKHGHGRLNFG